MSIPLPSLGFSVSGWYPPARARRCGYFDARIGTGFAVKVAGPEDLPGSVSATPDSCELKLKQELTDDLEAELDVSALAEAFADGSISSPQEFGTALLEAFGLETKLGLPGDLEIEVGVSYDPKAPFCLFEAELPLANIRYPREGFWNLPGSDVDVAIELEGVLKLRFGPNERGWAWLAQRSRPAARALIQRIALATGSQTLGQTLLRAGGFVAAVAAISAAVTYTSAYLCERARHEGIVWALAVEYALGYVGVLWVPIGVPGEDERAFRRAQGNHARNTQQARARQLGVTHAIQDISDAGGGQHGAIAVRRYFFRELGLYGIDVRRPGRNAEPRARAALVERLRREEQTVRPGARRRASAG